MANPSKRKGTSFEVLIRDYLIEEMDDDRIMRLAQAGAKDGGDIANLRVCGEKIAVECKDVKILSLPGGVDEAIKEAGNIGATIGVLIHKRRGKGQAKDQIVSMSAEHFIRLLKIVERP